MWKTLLVKKAVNDRVIHPLPVHTTNQIYSWHFDCDNDEIKSTSPQLWWNKNYNIFRSLWTEQSWTTIMVHAIWRLTFTAGIKLIITKLERFWALKFIVIHRGKKVSEEVLSFFVTIVDNKLCAKKQNKNSIKSNAFSTRDLHSRPLQDLFHLRKLVPGPCHWG